MSQPDNTTNLPGLSPLKRALLAIDQLQVRLDAAERVRHEPIAVVGMACRFPGGVDSPAAFWAMLREGREGVGEVPADRWDIDALYDPDPDAPGKMSTRRGGFLSDVAGFEPQFFGISPREAASMDPQQRVLLEVVWEALEHAAIAPDKLGGTRTGVFVGMTSNDYTQVQLQAAGVEGLDTYYASGASHAIASGRVSYLLGLRGPSLTLDTACSSSLVAVHLAVQSLRAGESDLALAGGVNLMLSAENSVMLSKLHMMAPDGRCKAFDASADGFVRGEGCGIVALKRLHDAQAAGDHVLAMIRGSAVNQDGASSGLTAPNGPAQEAVVRAAIADAGVAPGDVGYVEAHGTGTALGDPIEVQALAAALGAGRAPEEPLAIGSVKTNIGHLEAVAGVAGLMKAILVVQHGEIPPHLHLREPNPHIDWASLPVVVPAGGSVWPRAGRRIAGVSAFGFSGTNAHVVVEQPPAPAPASPTDGPPRPNVLVLSGRTEPALRESATRFAAALASTGVDDLCTTAAVGRAQLAMRAAFVATSEAELADRLDAFAATGAPAPGAPVGTVTRTDPARVALLFSGQGAQYAGMAAALYRSEPVFAAVVDRCAATIDAELRVPLRDVLFAEPGSEHAALLDQTAFTQPALFAMEVGLAELWGSWGIAPSALLGHSVGEYAAAVVAGVLDVEAGARLIAARGRLMQALPTGGAMTAIFAPVADVEVAIAALVPSDRDLIGIAAINGPAHTVVSGAAPAVAAVAAVLADRGARVQQLAVSHAFHSPLMAPMLREFAEVARSTSFAPPRRRVVSNVTGAVVGEELADPEHWVRHVLAPVRFADGIAAVLGVGVDTFIEVGPHPVLVGMGQACVEPGTATWVGSLRRGRDDDQQLMTALAELFVAGVDVDWEAVQRGRGRRVDAPTTPFQRQRHWVRATRRPAVAGAAPGAHPLLGARWPSPSRSRTYAAELATASFGFLDDHRVAGTAITPAAAFVEIALAAAGATTGPSTAAPTVPVAVEDVVIHAAMALPDDGVSLVQTIVDGDAIEVHGSRDGEAWTLHAAARAATAAAPARLDLAAVLARTSEVLDAAAHHELLRARGLEFGPSLRGVAAIHVGDGEAIGEVQLPEAEVATAVRYGIHPALLDAALQVLGAVAVAATDDDEAVYLPVAIDRVTLHRAGATRAWSHARLREVAPGVPTLTADVLVADDKGAAIATVEGLRLVRADAAALARLAGAASTDDWLYTVSWRRLDADEEAGGHAALAPVAAMAEAAGAAVEPVAADVELDRHQAMLDELEAITTTLFVDALSRLGASLEPGASIRLDGLGIAPRHLALVRELLRELVADGVVAAAERPDEWVVRRAVATELGEARWAALLDAHPDGIGEIATTRRCGEQLARILTGEVDPLEVLFPGGSLDSAAQMYQISPLARFSNSIAAAAVAAAIGAAPGDAVAPPVRVLEIGAGTGGTTAFVLPRLPAGRYEYTFTDVSAYFLGPAQDKFADVDGVRYRTLDIEGDLDAQGFGGERFDVVVAANVLHATADLRHTLAQVRRLLAPGGRLVIVEMVAAQRFISITFGLTDGWWRFADRELRPHSLLLDAAGWTRVLGQAGFTEAQALPAPTGGPVTARTVQAVLVAGAPAAPSAGEWLVVAAGESSMAEAVAAELAQRGVAARRATAVGPGSAPGPDGGVAVVLDGPEALAEALAHTQELIAAAAATRLCFVTRGAQPAGGTLADPVAAAVWGFARSVALEHPELAPRCVDADPAPELAGHPAQVRRLVDGLLADGREDQLALRGAGTFVARLTHLPHPSRTAAPLELAVTDRGTLDNLVLRPIVRRPPGPGEVEIRVYASGLNFKDVLNALGMYPGDPGPLGGELSGVVVAIGAGVDRLAVGDAVVAIAPGSLRSHVTCAADLVVLKPPELSFEAAAGLLIPNVTARFALDHVGRLRAGERVLVHAGAGGVGMAAVYLALREGAEVVATAGDDAKRDLLRRLGVAHVYDSRHLGFADAIRADLGHGDGDRDPEAGCVDVVLNSLAGEFASRSMALLGRGGRFLEIGKRDLVGEHEAAAAGVDYHVIDWGETAAAEPERIRAVLVEVVDAAASGALPLLPLTVFDLDEHIAAFRFMAQARHIGKVVLRLPHAAAEANPPGIRADGTYLITGGLGGLGLLTGEHLVGRGARHLALLGRRGPSAAATATIADLEARGAEVRVFAGDVSQRADVVAVLDAIAASPAPLAGVFHAAGALDDGAVAQQTWERFRHVLAAKVDGARHLDELTRQTDGAPGARGLDHFVLYASVASMFGSPGQANHAAANASLDALAARRRACGLPGLSIDWGAWSEVGAAAERGVDKLVGRRGIGVIPPADGLAILDRLLDGADAQVGVSPVDWPVFLKRDAAGRRPAFFDEVAAPPTRGRTTDAPRTGSDLAARLAAASPERRAAMVVDAVREQVAHVLALDPAQVADRVPLSDLGLDSLMAVELRNLLGAVLGQSRSIPATLVFDYPTVEAIAAFLGDGLDAAASAAADESGEAQVAATPPARTDGALVASLIDDLERLSDEEIEAQLARRGGS